MLHITHIYLHPRVELHLVPAVLQLIHAGSHPNKVELRLTHTELCLAQLCYNTPTLRYISPALRYILPTVSYILPTVTYILYLH